MLTGWETNSGASPSGTKDNQSNVQLSCERCKGETGNRRLPGAGHPQEKKSLIRAVKLMGNRTLVNHSLEYSSGYWRLGKRQPKDVLCRWLARFSLGLRRCARGARGVPPRQRSRLFCCGNLLEGAGAEKAVPVRSPFSQSRSQPRSTPPAPLGHSLQGRLPSHSEATAKECMVLVEERPAAPGGMRAAFPRGRAQVLQVRCNRYQCNHSIHYVCW